MASTLDRGAADGVGEGDGDGAAVAVGEGEAVRIGVDIGEAEGVKGASAADAQAVMASAISSIEASGGRVSACTVPLGQRRVARYHLSRVTLRAVTELPQSSVPMGALRIGVRRLLFGYLALVIGLSLVNGGLSADALIFIGLAVVLAGVVSTRLASGWLSVVVIFVAWETMRGVAATFGNAVVVKPIVEAERALAFGIVPAVELQALFHAPGELNALDLGMTLVYALLAAAPVIVGVALWRHARPLFLRFVLALLAVSLIQFGFALLVPVAPPRFAAAYGVPLAVEDIMGLAWAQLGAWGTWLYTHAIGNPLAAFPSLHAAYPILTLLAAREVWPRGSWLLAGWALLVFVSVLYLGHHYLVDVYAGIALALVVHWLVRRWWERTTSPVPDEIPERLAPPATA